LTAQFWFNVVWQTIGQSKIVDLLQRALERGTLSHAYLLVGPPQIGKMTLALDLAMTVNCRSQNGQRPCGECVSCQKIAAGKHADVQVIGLNQSLNSEDTKERTEIGIDQVKDMLHSVSLPPFEGQYRVYIIDEASNLSLDAANRLLKTLEEPIGKVIFVLLTANVRLIPATVVSRCQRLKLTRMKVSEIESVLSTRWRVEPEKARLLSRLSHGCPGWAIGATKVPNLLQARSEKFERMLMMVRGDLNERFGIASQLALQFGKKRETVYEILDTWAGWWRDILLAKTGCSSDVVNIDYMSTLVKMARAYSLAQIKSIIRSIMEAGEQLKLNANSRLVLESLMLNIPRPLIDKMPGQQDEVKNA
jgi:DNA polymerase-3 subunit delta'